MDSDQGKLFVFGLAYMTTELSLLMYFSKYGQVLQTCVMRDPKTGVTRCYGFVVFADPSVVSTVLQDTHKIDLTTVKVKRPEPKADNCDAGRNFGGSRGKDRTNKILVRGLPLLSEGEFRHYFESYGMVTDVLVLCEQQTFQPRGYGVITYDSEDAVDRVLHKKYHDLGGKQVKVKRLIPKDGDGGAQSRP